jgi:hypothetical protein
MSLRRTALAVTTSAAALLSGCQTLSFIEANVTPCGPGGDEGWLARGKMVINTLPGGRKLNVPFVSGTEVRGVTEPLMFVRPASPEMVAAFNQKATNPFAPFRQDLKNPIPGMNKPTMTFCIAGEPHTVTVGPVAIGNYTENNQTLPFAVRPVVGNLRFLNTGDRQLQVNLVPGLR